MSQIAPNEDHKTEDEAQYRTPDRCGSEKDGSEAAASEASTTAALNTNSEKQEPPPDETKEASDKREDAEEEDPEVYPTGLRLIFVTVSLCLTVFLFALDGTILATVLPQITDHFGTIDDIAWYSAAFFLTTCAFQLPFGRAYALLNTKWTYQGSVVVFLIGSAICGATPTSIGLIIGRAIAGIGGAGVIGGVFIIISKSIPLRKRSLYAGFVGAALSISSVLGPVIGGAFTTHASWRWCFYLNLPVGAAVLVFIFFCLPDIARTNADFKGLNWWQKIEKFDPFGTIILLGSIISLILALQWGGANGNWGEGRTIATLVVFAATIVVWAVVQYRRGEDATLPWSVAKQRTVAGATAYALLGSSAFTLIVYWLPVWFQSIKGDTAEMSGIHNLPLTIGIIVFSLGAGGLTMLIGYYSIFLVLGSVLTSTGAGLLYTLQTDSGSGSWIGYQVIFAAGVGMSLEQCNIAVQTVLPDEQIPSGASLIIFSRSLAGAIASAIGQNVYQKTLRDRLRGLVPASVLSGPSGATNFIKSVQDTIGNDPARLRQVYQAINHSLTRVFMVALILACLTLPFAFVIEWKSVKKEKRAAEDAKENPKAKTGAVKAVKAAASPV